MAGKSGSNLIGKDIYPVYVVYGKDRRMVVDTAGQIKDKVVGQADEQLCLSSYEGNDVELAEVLDDLRTVPFLSEYRLVVVKQADEFIKQYRENLEKYLENPSKSGVLLLMPDSFPKNTRLAKAVVKIGKVVDCEPVKAAQLAGYLAEYAKSEYKLTLSRRAASVLIELAGDESGILLSEIDKLATYLADRQDNKEINAKDVQDLVGHNRQYSVFNVIDAMSGGYKAMALLRLDQMLGQDREAEYKSIGAFAWHFRRLYTARLMMDKRVSAQVIIRNVRIWAGQEQFIRQVRQISLKDVCGALQTLTEIDYASKTGGGSVRTGLEKFIVQFCRSRQRVA